MAKEFNENVEELFSPGTEVETQTQKNTTEFKPSAHKGKNNVYHAVVRFVPWWKDPKHGSIKDKWVSYLIDPTTEKGRYVDCPSSVGKHSPLLDMYRKLKNSESAQEQKLADTFHRRHSFASLVQVIRDENNPDLEGKILVWRFGVKIYEKIMSVLKPVYDEPHDPFDLLNGKAFELKVTKVSGYNNYDQSKFLDKRIPLLIPDSEGNPKPITKDSDKKKVFEWVKENSPDLDRYGYTEWDQETLEYVNHVINAVTGKANVASQYSDVVNSQKDSQSQNSGQSQSKGQVESQSNESVSAENIEIEDTDVESESDDDDTNLDDLPTISEEEEDNSGSDDQGIQGDLDDILKNA